MSTDHVDVLRQLIGFATESRTSNTNLIDFYADQSSALGGIVEIVTGEAGPESRANLHVRFGPEIEGGLLLSGHTDVVPAGSGWDTNPYELSRSERKLYGRGTADMKGFLAAALEAVSRVRIDTLRRPVHLALSYDEEIGCVGVRHLLDHLRAGQTCQPEMIIVGEPTQMQLCTAHSGKRAYRVEISSPSGHSSRSPEQPTSIEAAGAIVAAVFDVNEASRRDGGRYSANVGTIHGGVAVNVLSPTCDLDFECRHPDAFSPDQLLQQVFATVDLWSDRLKDSGGDLTVSSTVAYPALTTSCEDEAVVALHSAMDSPTFGEVTFGCEAGLYSEALPSPAVIYGPGNIADAHRPNEFVLTDELEATVSRLSGAIGQFCVRPNYNGGE